MNVKLFRELSANAKILYHVARRVKNHKTNSFFHSINTLAEISGLSESSTRRGLAELVNAGILKRTERTGHSCLYTFISEAPLFDTPALSDLQPTPIESDTRNNRDLTNRDLTTTWLSKKLLEKLSKFYALDEIKKRVVAISKMNGTVKNKAGLLVDSLKNGYIPTNKELTRKEKEEKTKQMIETQSERMLKQFENWKSEQSKSNLTDQQIRDMINSIFNAK